MMKTTAMMSWTVSLSWNYINWSMSTSSCYMAWESDTRASLVELYNPDRFGTRGQAFGVGDFLAVDLRDGWDMNDLKM
eukprot:9129194-Karenia_brevis.AAC.1